MPPEPTLIAPVLVASMVRLPVTRSVPVLLKVKVDDEPTQARLPVMSTTLPAVPAELTLPEPLRVRPPELTVSVPVARLTAASPLSARALPTVKAAVPAPVTAPPALMVKPPVVAKTPPVATVSGAASVALATRRLLPATSSEPAVRLSTLASVAAPAPVSVIVPASARSYRAILPMFRSLMPLWRTMEAPPVVPPPAEVKVTLPATLRSAEPRLLIVAPPDMDSAERPVSTLAPRLTVPAVCVSAPPKLMAPAPSV